MQYTREAVSADAGVCAEAEDEGTLRNDHG